MRPTARSIRYALFTATVAMLPLAHVNVHASGDCGLYYCGDLCVLRGGGGGWEDLQCSGDCPSDHSSCTAGPGCTICIWCEADEGWICS
jgi:hypothetical protein